MRLPPDAIFRYVPIDLLREYVEIGWLPVADLGPPHSHYSLLAAWLCKCPASVPCRN
jgi:hypothetical protein